MYNDLAYYTSRLYKLLVKLNPKRWLGRLQMIAYAQRSASSGSPRLLPSPSCTWLPNSPSSKSRTGPIDYLTMSAGGTSSPKTWKPLIWKKFVIKFSIYTIRPNSPIWQLQPPRQMAKQQHLKQRQKQHCLKLQQEPCHPGVDSA